MKKVLRRSIAPVIVAVIGAVVVASATGSKRAGILACGLMPDTKTSVRWEQFEAVSAEGLQGRGRARPGRERPG